MAGRGRGGRAWQGWQGVAGVAGRGRRDRVTFFLSFTRKMEFRHFTTSLVGTIHDETDEHVYVTVLSPGELYRKVVELPREATTSESHPWPWPNPRVEVGDKIEFQSNTSPEIYPETRRSVAKKRSRKKKKSSLISDPTSRVGEVLFSTPLQTYITVRVLEGSYEGDTVRLSNVKDSNGKIDFWGKGLLTERVYAQLIERNAGRQNLGSGVISSFVRQRSAQSRRRSSQRKKTHTKRAAQV